MNAGKMLFPVTMLALIAGCSPNSGGKPGTEAKERTGERAVLPDSAMTPDTPPPPTTALADTQVAQDGEREAVRRTPADPTMAAPLRLPPTKPSVIDIPPPASVPDLPPGDGAADPRPFPDEVTRYMVDRDSCDHFRGEEAYDVERLAYLQENIAALCTGTDIRLALLRQRYALDPAVMSALRGYDDRIEGNASQ